MSFTAQQLIRELAERQGELALGTAEAGGSTTTLVATDLTQWWPVDHNKLNCWVYGSSTADASNRTLERRGSSWSADNVTLTLAAPGFAAACTTGVYEIHARTRRTRKLEALNEAIGQLQLYWYRPVVDDTSITTAANTWTYTLPSSVNWSEFPRIHIQINTDVTATGYPYADADPWNWEVRRAVSSTGVETWTLQFGLLPPPGRKIRIFAEAGYVDLVLDADILPIAGKWGRLAHAWIMAYSQMLLDDWEASRQPAGQIDRERLMRDDRLKRQLELLMRTAPGHENAKLVIPGHGDGIFPNGRSPNPAWLAVFKSMGGL